MCVGTLVLAGANYARAAESLSMAENLCQPAPAPSLSSLDTFGWAGQDISLTQNR